MRTITTKKIDGIEIVSGFGDQAVEPVETRKRVAIAMQETDEFKAVKTAQDKRNNAVKMANAAGAKVKELVRAGKKTDAGKYFREGQIYLQQAQGHENEIKGLLPGLKKKQKELRQSMAVYFETRSGEYPAEESVIAGLIEKMKNGDLVSLSGKVIPDNRGIVYAVANGNKFKVTEIGLIGVSIPKNAILYEDLEPDQKKSVDLQIEIDSSAKLLPAEKIETKIAMTDASLHEAAGLRSRLEISGAADPLGESQAWYNKRLTELDLIYN